ncbi:MAG: sodium:proton antiporter [Ruminococcaceae bacterium]|nr:sodium:proton antiporter [Oscillospiraceae bacterium]
MIELAVLGLFVLALILCICCKASVIFALVFGFFLFFGYGIYKGHGFRAMAAMAFSGVRNVKGVLLILFFIGAITALWRASGTIPYIVAQAADLFDPRFMVLLSFLLCVLISMLTGTAFGTAATMGVICMTVANSMGLNPVFVGGAIMSGSYFGDRCSPMSTSALLICSLTGTDIYRNIANSFKTGMVPLLLSCVIYLLMGLGGHGSGSSANVRELFASAFRLRWELLIPALVIVVLALFRVKPMRTMSVSILCAALLCLLVQGMTIGEMLHAVVFGFYPEDATLAALLSGGGIVSMASVFVIVCISSTYSGMFGGTGLLDGFRSALVRLGERILPFGSIILTGLVANMIACNQTLSIMLTQQLCADVEPEREKMAVSLENTAVVFAPLVPWSIGCTVTTASSNAPLSSALAACFLYLIPIWNYLVAYIKKDRIK